MIVDGSEAIWGKVSVRPYLKKQNKKLKKQKD
jgi:hypothetical protein